MVGGKPVDHYQLLLEHLSKIKSSIPSVDRQIYLRDMYDISYGIYNHISTTRPLSSVAMFDHEDFVRHSHLSLTVKNYLYHDIKNIYGLTYHEWMELPMDIKSILMDEAKEVLENKRKELEQLEQEHNPDNAVISSMSGINRV